MHDVFISYAHPDKAVADIVCQTLESSGIDCWIAPRDILPGMSWSEAIIDGIENCHIMLLIFSAGANESPQVCREIERAVHKGLAVVPLRVEDVLPDKEFEYFLGAVHWLDAWHPSVEVHLPNLLDNVAALLTRITKQEFVPSYRAPVPAVVAPYNPPTRPPTREAVASFRAPSPEVVLRELERHAEAEAHHEAHHHAARPHTTTQQTAGQNETIPCADPLCQAGLESVRFEAGETLFCQGENGDSMYILEEGQMEVSFCLPDGTERTIGTIEPPATIGEMSLLLDKVRTATVRARTEARLWRISHEKFQEGLKKRERWAIKMMVGIAQTLAHRVEGMNQSFITQIDQIHQLEDQLEPGPVEEELEDLCDRLFTHGAF